MARGRSIALIRALASGGVEFSRVVSGGLELWRWEAAGTVPELVAIVAGVNTLMCYC